MWHKLLEYFVASILLVIPETEEGIVSMEKCSVIDCVCHGREESESDFLGAFFTDAHVDLPFNKITMRVLHILNVAPTQLHSNSWGYLQCFRLLCEMFGLTPSPQSFLHCYSARSSTPVRWVSLVSQSKSALFSPYIISYKTLQDWLLLCYHRAGWSKSIFIMVTSQSSPFTGWVTLYNICSGQGLQWLMRIKWFLAFLIGFRGYLLGNFSSFFFAINAGLIWVVCILLHSHVVIIL